MNLSKTQLSYVRDIVEGYLRVASHLDAPYVSNVIPLHLAVDRFLTVENYKLRDKESNKLSADLNVAILPGLVSICPLDKVKYKNFVQQYEGCLKELLEEYKIPHKHKTGEIDIRRLVIWLDRKLGASIVPAEVAA